MKPRAVHEHKGHSPEFGMLVVRDAPVGPDGGPPAEHAIEAPPCGTIARSGHGQLEASAGDGRHAVRLERHDSPPPLGDRWTDVVETPYITSTGAVGLTSVTGGPAPRHLDVGPGPHRVRVSRRGKRWLLQFWPEVDPRPPRWLRRGAPAVRPGSTGWRELLDYRLIEVLDVVHMATFDHPATFEEVRAWAVAHRRPEGWFDEPPLRPPPRPLPTGHPDLDAAARTRWEEVAEEDRRKTAELARFATHLGVRAPTTRRDVLALFAAAGALSLDESRRYRLVDDPPPAWRVLDLPADQVDRLDRGDKATRYAPFASDLVSTVAWSRALGEYGTAVAAPPVLAERLLAPESDVRKTLEYAASTGLLAVDGDVLRVLPTRPVRPLGGYVQPPRPGPPWSAPPPAAATGGRPEPYRPPEGVPPRAGVITASGDLLTWRGTERVVRARRPGAQRALETAHGVVVLGHGDTPALIRPDGTVDPLGRDLMPNAALDTDGRHLAAIELPRSALHVIDLADNTRRTLRTPVTGLIAFHDGTVHFTREGTPMRWTPGSTPEPADPTLRAVDPLTGTTLHIEGTEGVLVTTPTGTTRRIAVDQGVSLVPGAEALFSFRHSPPALTLFPLDDPLSPKVFWLPEGSVVCTGHPVWEDPHTLLVRIGEPHNLGTGVPAVRLDIRTGHFETAPMPGAGPFGATFITPLPRRD